MVVNKFKPFAMIESVLFPKNATLVDTINSWKNTFYQNLQLKSTELNIQKDFAKASFEWYTKAPFDEMVCQTKHIHCLHFLFL